MRHAAPLCFAPLLCLAIILAAQSKQQEDVQGGKRHAGLLQTTVCEVVAAPASFDGEMIEVRGDVFAGLETNILYDNNCKDKSGLPARVLFTDGRILKADQNDRQQHEDAGYRTFWRLVGAYKQPKGKHHSMLPDKYTVTATLVGRYEVSKPSVPGTGFPGKLVMTSVRDVVTRDFGTAF